VAHASGHVVKFSELGGETTGPGRGRERLPTSKRGGVGGCFRVGASALFEIKEQRS
jgi:hypothetical protein